MPDLATFPELGELVEATTDVIRLPDVYDLGTFNPVHSEVIVRHCGVAILEPATATLVEKAWR